MKIIIASSLVLSSSLYAKGLKDLNPGPVPQAKNSPAAPAKPIPSTPAASKPIPQKPTQAPAPEKPANEIAKVVKEKKPESSLDGKFGLGLNFVFHSLKGEVGDWATGFGGGILMRFRVAKFSEKLSLQATYNYSPVDVLVTVNRDQYRGVVDRHLAGVALDYNIKRNLKFANRLDLGFSDIRLDAINTIDEGNDDPEGNGFAAQISSGLLWEFQDKLWFGGSLALATGNFTGLSAGVQTVFVM